MTGGYLSSALAVFVIVCVCTVMLWAVARWLGVWLGKGTAKPPGEGVVDRPAPEKSA